VTTPAPDWAIARDAWHGGKLSLWQPAKGRGYRVAIDAALLAAATPLKPGERALELGAGVGAAALALATRVPRARVDAVEIQPALAALARRNVAENALQDRVTVIEADLLDLPPPADGGYDEVMFNPPYLTADANDASTDPVRRIATVEGPAKLDDWMTAAAAQTAPGGGVTLIHRADRLADVLAAAAAAGVGGIAIAPLWPRQGEAARRILVRGRVGRGGRLQLGAGLTLHDADGGFTPAAAAILAGDAAFDI